MRSTIPTPVKAAILLAFLASPLLAMRLNPNGYEGGRLKNERDRELRNSSAIATILGEVRTNLSDLMFMKTELYLHNGVAYAAHLDLNRAAQTGEVIDKKTARAQAEAERTAGTSLEPVFIDSAGFAQTEGQHQHEHEHDADHDHDHDHHDHDHDHEHHDHEHDHHGHDHAHDHDHDHEHAGHDDSGAETLIPPKEKDFRGFVGYLHRQVKPWQDPNMPHVHTPGEEMLPWYRLMTLSDPHNIRAYLLGTWWLKNKRTEVHDEEALKFINEGIVNNPHAYALYLMRGHLLREKDNNAARESYQQAGDLAIEARPKELRGVVAPTEEQFAKYGWTDYNEDDARASVRMAVFSEREWGNPGEALKLARKYNEALGGDGRLEAEIKRLLEEGHGP